MKKSFLIIIAVFQISCIFAQNQQNIQVKTNEVGIHAGAVTGLGFSYRHWFGKYGFQLTGIPVKTENTEIYSIAITALYNFYDNRYFRVYGYLGNHYFYDEESGDKQPWKDFDPHFNNDNGSNYYDENSYYFKKSYNIGLGPGFAFGNRVCFNLMVGYGFYDILGAFEMYPSGEIGLYYRF